MLQNSSIHLRLKKRAWLDFHIHPSHKLMVCTRLDIAHAVGVITSFLNNPKKEHWEIVK